MVPLLVPDPETLHLDLDDRPVCGQDLLFLQQWYKLSRNDMCYLLGLTDMKWCHYTNPQHVQEPLGDPAVSLLVWVLAHYPETVFLPSFPTAAEVYPLYERLAEQGAQRSRGRGRGRDRPYLGRTMFSLLLGREIGSASRWLSETQPATIAPTVARLLFVLKTLLQNQGVAGLDEWVEQAQLEAQARGLSLHDKMTSWFRGDGEQKVSNPRPPVRRQPGTRKKPKKETPDAADDLTPAAE
jgi:hypothetical protein